METGRYALTWLAGDAEGGNTLDPDPRRSKHRRISGIAAAPDGNVFFADAVNHQIRVYTPSGSNSLVAGRLDGTSGYFGEDLPADGSPLSSPSGLVLDERTGIVYFADTGNGRIRCFAPGGRLYTVAGGGTDAGPTVSRALDARLVAPCGLALGGDGALVFTERATGKVRRVTRGGALETLATLSSGRGGPVAARWRDGLVWAVDGDRIVWLPAAVGGSEPPGVAYTRPGTEITAIACDQAGSLYVACRDAGADGRSGTRIFRVAVREDGHLAEGAVPESVAGRAGEAASLDAYPLPSEAEIDAETQQLAGAGEYSLAIVPSQTGEATSLPRALVAGSSYEDPAATVAWAQLFALSPR